MSKNDALYAAYDGPLPRPAGFFSSAVCYEQMLRGLLRTVRIRRRRGDMAALPALQEQIRQTHVYLRRDMG